MAAKKTTILKHLTRKAAFPSHPQSQLRLGVRGSGWLNLFLQHGRFFRSHRNGGYHLPSQCSVLLAYKAMCTESHVIYETTVSNHVCSFFVRQPCQTYNYTTTNNSPQHGVDEVVVDRPGPVRPDRRPAGPPARPSGLLTRPSMKALLTSRRSGLPTQWWPHTERFSSIVAILTRCV